MIDIDNMIPEEEIEKYYTTRETEKEDYECSQDYIDYINESAIYHAGGYVYE